MNKEDYYKDKYMFELEDNIELLDKNRKLLDRIIELEESNCLRTQTKRLSIVYPNKKSIESLKSDTSI